MAEPTRPTHGQSTAARLSKASARRFTLTLYDHEAVGLETIRRHIGARSRAETVRRLIVSAASRIALQQPNALFEDGLIPADGQGAEADA